MRFNINEYVKVRLTQKGHLAHKADHLHFWGNLNEYTPPEEDADGWSRWQMWRLMNTFGRHVYMTADQPFEAEIIIGEEQ